MSEELNTKEKGLRPLPEDIEKVYNLFVDDRMRLVYEMPFYGMLLLEIIDLVVTGDEIPIGATNYRQMFYNGIPASRRSKEDKTKGICYYELSDKGRKTLLAHEILHLVFEHLSIPKSYNQSIANIAMDAVINRILFNDGGTNFDLSEISPACVTPIKKGYGNILTGISIGEGASRKEYEIPDYENKDWLPIYWDIMEQIEKQCSKKGMTPEQIANAIAKECDKLGGLNPLNGDTQGDGNNSEEGSPEYEQAKVRFRHKLVSILDSCKKQGTLPAGFERFADSLCDGKVHWTTYLRNILRDTLSKDDFSYKINSRRAHYRFNGRRMPPIYPKVESLGIGDVFLALDTSGSMSQQDIIDGLSEFAGLRQTEPFNVYFMSCDAEAYEVKFYDRLEEPDWSSLPIHGGGGTDFRPVFSKIEEFREEAGARPALLVYFTDTMGSFPDNEPDYPVIWVCNYRNGNVPWGTYVSTVD